MVGLGSLLLAAFGWYRSRGFWVIPACRLFLTLNISLLTEMTQNRLSRHWNQGLKREDTRRPAWTVEHLLGEGRRFTWSVLFGVDRLRVGVGECDAYCLTVFHEDGLGGCDTRVLEVHIRHHSLGHMKLVLLVIVFQDSRSVLLGWSPIGSHNGLGLSLRWYHHVSRGSVVLISVHLLWSWLCHCAL